MITSTTSIFRRLFFIIPILTTGFWIFFAQKGCELTPDTRPTPGLAEGGSQSSKPKSQSLQRASALLRQAADMVDKDNPLAVRLIRQAIAILKHEVMPGIDAQDYDRVSMPSAPGLNETKERNPLEEMHHAPNPSLQGLGNPTEAHDAKRRGATGSGILRG